MLWQFGPYGSQAVIAFFVLSGFVIAHVSARPGADAMEYTVARAARIWSVALPALAVTLLLDLIGSALNPGLYQPWWGYAGDQLGWRYATALTFTGQLWWLGVTVGSNLPYWSLQYEVWYYVIFGLAVFASPRWRVAAVLAAMAIAGPPILALLPIWLLGVLVYRFCATRPVGRRAGMMLALGSGLGWLGYEAAAAVFGRPASGAWLLRPELLQDYIVAALFALHIIGVHGWTRGMRPLPERLAGPVRWTAGATFSLYLLHVPVAQFLAAISPWPPTAWTHRLLLPLVTLALIFAVAEVTERRKDAWRRAVAPLLARAARRRIAAG
jgi:peptidoglycan/LPS O-acetylase OafA/YrhL